MNEPIQNEIASFNPPDDYRFEAELESERPRGLPDSIKSGSFYLRRRRMQIILLVSAIICSGLSIVPFIQNWGHYFIPLGYLEWVSAGLIAIFMISFLKGSLKSGPYRYIQDGIPFAAQVLSIVKMPTGYRNGQPAGYALRTEIQFIHPETNTTEIREVFSAPCAPAKKDSLGTSLKEGDYVTAIYLPDKFDKTLTLYGFLGLTEESSLIQKPQKKQGQPESLWSYFLLAYMFLFIFMIFSSFWAFKYMPVDFRLSIFKDYAIPIVIGSIVNCVLIFAFFRHFEIRQRKAIEVRNQQRHTANGMVEITPQSLFQSKVTSLVLLFGGLLMGTLFISLGYCTYNAVFDASEPDRVPVEIQSMQTVTEGLLFRHYQVTFNFINSTKKHDFNLSYDDFQEFNSNMGVAEIKAGRLGWQWIRSIEPLTEENDSILDEIY